jgi:hypothetical protein
VSPLIGLIVHSESHDRLNTVRVTGVSTPTRPFKENEDWLGSGPGLVVVLDGCGAPDVLAGDVDRHCVHGLTWYVRTLGTALLRGGADLATPLDDALATAIAETATAHYGRCDLTHPHTPAATVVVLRENRLNVEYLVLADASLVIDDGSDEPIVITDDRVARLDLPSFGDAAADGPQFVEICRQRQRRICEVRNRPEGYPIAAADPQAAYRALTGHISKDRVRRALLASNGATRLVEVFGQLDWTQLLDLADKEGPEEVIIRTRDVEKSDVDRTTWPRGRTHDDATVAFCAF